MTERSATVLTRPRVIEKSGDSTDGQNLRANGDTGDAGIPMSAHVHAKDVNAFWEGEKMHYGDARSPDVAAHEAAHEAFNWTDAEKVGLLPGDIVGQGNFPGGSGINPLMLARGPISHGRLDSFISALTGNIKIGGAATPEVQAAQAKALHIAADRIAAAETPEKMVAASRAFSEALAEVFRGKGWGQAASPIANIVANYMVQHQMFKATDDLGVSANIR